MGIGIADGDNRAKDAATQAVNSPLLDVSIAGAKGVLFVVAGNEDLGILEVQEAAKVVSDSVDKSAKVIFGIMRDEKLKKGQIRIIVIATGFPEGSGESSSMGERSLFSLTPKEQNDTRGKIYNDMMKRDDEEEAPKKKEEPVVTATPQKRDEAKTITPVVEEDEGFGVIPSFLRRNKNK